MYHHCSVVKDTPPATEQATDQVSAADYSLPVNELESAGVNPSAIPMCIRKQLCFGNAIGKEIKQTYLINKTQAKKNVIKTVVFGKVVEKKRFASLMEKKCGIDRKVECVNSKEVVLKRRQRLPQLRKRLRETVEKYL